MNIIEQLQTDVAGRLQSLEYFEDVAVAAPRLFRDGDKLSTPKSIDENLDRALTGLTLTGGRVGAAVRVLQPLFTTEHRNLPGPKGRLVLTVRCQVHPTINFGPNGTGKYVTSIAIEVARALHGWVVSGFNWRLHADGDTIQPYFDEEKNLLTAEVLIHTQVQIPPLESLALPALALSRQELVQHDYTVTITVPEGQSVYYTTDGETFPREGRGTIYTEPFHADYGTVLRWAAYAPGSAGSSVGYQIVPTPNET